MATSSWTIQLLTSERFDEAMELFVDVFQSQEPPSVALGVSKDDLYQSFPVDKMKSLLKHKLSLVAVTASNEIIGVRFMDGIFSPPTESDAPVPIIKPLFAMFESLFSCMDMTEFQSDPSDKLAYGVAVAVKTTRGGEGIGKALMMESVRLAKKNGYKYCFLLLTSKYSLKIALKLGFKLKAFKKYQEFEYNGQKPFMNVNPEHEGVGLAVIDLDHFQGTHV